MTKIDEVAGKSINGNHIWYLDFAHRVIPIPTGGSLIWNTFKYYMQQIADLYGRNGSDRIWFAPQMEVLDYLKLRENTYVNYSKSGNRVDIYLNINQSITNISNYFLSLNVAANAELISVSPQFSANINFANTSPTQKLINVEWSQTTMKRIKTVNSTNSSLNQESEGEFQVFPNPLYSNKLYIRFYNETELYHEAVLINSIGKEIFRRNINASIGLNNIELEVPQLEKGIYLLDIKSDGKRLHSEKIIVQ